MDRRDFLIKTIGSGIAAGTTLALPGMGRLLAATDAPKEYDLVAVMGSTPDQMFDRAMTAWGGIKKFVPKGSRVVVKPNIGWDVPPERAGNTHPALVGRIVELCMDAGATQVVVFDHSCDNWRRTYRNSGIEAAVKAAGGKLVAADSEEDYRKVAVPGGTRLKDALVHKALLDADVFINAPVLKHHSSSMVTIGMKNLMGVVWDRGYWHRNDLHQCIADFASFRKPDLTVVDAFNVMKRNGPRGVSVNDVVSVKAQVVSADPVAADAAAVKIFGAEPGDIRHIQIAHQMGLGRMDLENLSIQRIRI
ncbi:DUF362 domain-containing protein [uncultured Desulfobacter sp.]|uniref:DUF362 domain-containing protein n=1 Tax=uncultured Desulfobacter sp. TaxID=240139 RepID=UPI002AABCFE8|nr:DUF362 domain-containing protein [uncultured Desulfobacter sp.]